MSTTDPRPSPEAAATLPASLTASAAPIDLTHYGRPTVDGHRPSLFDFEAYRLSRQRR